jgi:hypothetical protein
MIAYMIIPLANLVAGPLADKIFEPLMQEGGALSTTYLASVVGVGAGRGIALIFIVSAFSRWLSSGYASANPPRNNNFHLDFSWPAFLALRLILRKF